VHGMESSQFTGVPLQLPSEQPSSSVHESPSSQGPSMWLVSQRPVSGEQRSIVQSSPSSQESCSEETQSPSSHEDSRVQGSPSSQAPVLWVSTHPSSPPQRQREQGSPSGHRKDSPMHPLPVQVSLDVQGSLSSQGVSLGAGERTHSPVSLSHLEVMQGQEGLSWQSESWVHEDEGMGSGSGKSIVSPSLSTPGSAEVRGVGEELSSLSQPHNPPKTRRTKNIIGLGRLLMNTLSGHHGGHERLYRGSVPWTKRHSG